VIVVTTVVGITAVGTTAVGGGRSGCPCRPPRGRVVAPRATGCPAQARKCRQQALPDRQPGRGRNGVAGIVFGLGHRPRLARVRHPPNLAARPIHTWYARVMDFRRTPLTELVGDVRAGKLGARDLVAHTLARIDVLNEVVNAFVAVDGDRAMEAAKAVDEAVAAGRDPGPLAGIPLAVKDLEDAEGYPTTHGSATSSGTPVERDSVLVARLRAAGCVVVGKTNTSEYGWKADTENALFGRTRNPWSTDHVAGGSSGGSAAAVASGMVPLATGSDGGGSIRIPSSCCGLTGFKPSLGRVPSGGPHAPDWHDLSTRGVMSRAIADAVHALDAVVGPDPSDLRSLPRPEASWTAALEDPRAPMRVAWSPTLGYAPVDDEVLSACRRALDALADSGVEIVEVDELFDHDPVDEWLTLAGVYNLRSIGDARGTPVWSKVDPLLAYQVDYAADSVSALDFLAALDACHRLNLRLVDLFHDVRLLITPTIAAPPPPASLGGAAIIDGQEELNWVRFTYPFNLTRSPAASVCVGLSAAGLPIGMQLVGPQHADLVVIRSAAALERVVGFGELAPIGT
jgi:Asp-tRNA(Asn)/Glu-tRNA(Gln) amidotransferase A subunit family amidase